MKIQLSRKSANFGSKMLVCSEKSNQPSGKFSKVKFLPKLRMQNSANAKPLNLELLTELT